MVTPTKYVAKTSVAGIAPTDAAWVCPTNAAHRLFKVKGEMPYAAVTRDAHRMKIKATPLCADFLEHVGVKLCYNRRSSTEGAYSHAECH